MSDSKTPTTFTPDKVLAAAFANHDFIGRLGDQDVHVVTSAVIADGTNRYIVVEVDPSDINDDTGLGHHQIPHRAGPCGGPSGLTFRGVEP